VASVPAGWLRLGVRFVGVALLAVLWLSVDVEQVRRALGRADGRLLALAAPAFAGFTLAKSARWWLLLRACGVRYAPARCVRVYHASAFLAFVTPGRLGDLAKAAWLRRDTGSGWATGVATTLIDRVLDLLVLSIPALAAALWAAPPGALRSALVLVFAAVGAAGAVLASPRWMRRLFEAVAGWSAFARVAAPMRRAVQPMWEPLERMHAGALLGPALLTVVQFASLFAGSFALAAGLGLGLGFATLVYCVTLASLVSLLPVSVSGVGTRDAALVLLFAPHGVAAPEALSFSLLYLVWSLVFSNGPGAWLWWRDPLPLDREVWSR